MNIVSETLQKSRIGQPQVYEQLTVVPIITSIDYEPEYISLDRALKTKTVRIREISSSGSVPEILFKNKGKKPVLLLDGEELVGAKQNRVLNMTILVPAKTTLTIPVSCVEQGRWGGYRSNFSSSDNLMFQTARMQKARAVSTNLDRSETRYADQHEVWNTLACRASDCQISSDTGAMGDIFEQQRDQLSQYLHAFSLPPNATGAVFLLNGKSVGFDLFDHPTTFAQIFPKLIQSHALDALPHSNSIAETESSTEISVSKAAQVILDQTSQCVTKHYRAIGEGTDIRLHDLTLVGGGLKAYQRLIHLCVFLGNDQTARQHSTPFDTEFASPFDARMAFRRGE